MIELIGKDESGKPIREVIMDGSTLDALQWIAREARKLCDLFDKQGCVSSTDMNALADRVIAFEKENA